MGRLTLLSFLALGSLAQVGCVSVQPWREVQARLPPANVVEVDGQAVHVEQSGSGEPVVLLHGFGESTYTWRLVAPALAERYRVVAIDLNGFGYTERPREPGAYTIDGQRRLVLAVLDRLGLGSVHLVGHSYGGGLALWIAAHDPARVRSLTLVDSAMPLYSATRRTASARLRPLTFAYLRLVALREGYIRRSLANAYRDDELATAEVARAYLDRLRVEGVDDAYYGLTAPNDEPLPEIDLASIATPALVVWGRHDTLTPLANGERITAALGAARLAVIEGCGHVPMEERPRELLAELLPFLAERAAAAR